MFDYWLGLDSSYMYNLKVMAYSFLLDNQKSQKDARYYSFPSMLIMYILLILSMTMKSQGPVEHGLQVWMYLISGR